MARRKINHNRRIIGRKTIRRDQIIPGQIIEFQYSGPNVYDKNPLIIFLFRDRTKKVDLMHGININYLYEIDVQNLFKIFSKFVKLSINYDLSGKGYSYVQLEKNPTVRTGVNAQDLYEEVISKQVLNRARTKNCYRTYYYNKMANIKLTHYKLDIIEDYIRSETGLTKNAIKTAELFKNLQEQKTEITYDEIQTESQDKIRKEIKE